MCAFIKCCFKGNIGGYSWETGWSAYVPSRAHKYIPSWTGLNWTELNQIRYMHIYHAMSCTDLCPCLKFASYCHGAHAGHGSSLAFFHSTHSPHWEKKKPTSHSIVSFGNRSTSLFEMWVSFYHHTLYATSCTGDGLVLLWWKHRTGRRLCFSFQAGLVYKRTRSLVSA